MSEPLPVHDHVAWLDRTIADYEHRIEEMRKIRGRVLADRERQDWTPYEDGLELDMLPDLTIRKDDDDAP